MTGPTTTTYLVVVVEQEPIPSKKKKKEEQDPINDHMIANSPIQYHVLARYLSVVSSLTTLFIKDTS